jgi:glycerol-3-phosphate dehydrogenase (NAD+)
MRWSRFFRRQQAGADAAGAARKVVVFGGGSFGTAMGASVARKWPDLDVVLLLRDEQLAADINGERINTKYLPGMLLPPNMRATTDAADATAGAGYAVHAVPVQHSRAFLEGVRDLLSPTTPIVCVSKGLEVGTGMMMSDVIPSALGRRQPATFISGPSFAREVMEGRPTGVVAASRDPKLARQVQALFASPCMRVNTSTDVVGERPLFLWEGVGGGRGVRTCLRPVSFNKPPTHTNSHKKNSLQTKHQKQQHQQASRCAAR